MNDKDYKIKFKEMNLLSKKYSNILINNVVRYLSKGYNSVEISRKLKINTVTIKIIKSDLKKVHIIEELPDN